MYALNLTGRRDPVRPCETCAWRCEACACCHCCADCGCVTCSNKACRCAHRPDPLAVAS